MSTSPALSAAIRLAVSAHDGQVDKDGKPYILHPLRVMIKGKDEDEYIVGVLHDVLEDHPEYHEAVTSTLVQSDRSRCLEALLLLTHDRSEPYDVYIQRIADSKNLLAIQVKLYDNADNADTVRLHQLEQATRDRLVLKYQRARAVLLAGWREARLARIIRPS